MQTIKNNYIDIEAIKDALVVNLSNSNTTLPDILNSTIILQGTLTANITVTLSNNVRTYRIINNCVGSYYVMIKTASGTGYNSYVHDVLEVACDGTSIKLINWNENELLNVERLTPDYYLGYQVYQKSIETPVLPSGSPVNVLTNIIGVITVFSIRLVAQNSAAAIPIPYTDPLVGTALAGVYVVRSDNSINITLGAAHSAGYKGVVKLRYIKA